MPTTSVRRWPASASSDRLFATTAPTTSTARATTLRRRTATRRPRAARAAVTCACGIRSLAGVRRGVVPRQKVLAPVVVEVAPDRVDVVRAVLRVVVLDEEARAADRVVVAVTRLLRPGPCERDLVQPAGDDALPVGKAPRPAGLGRRSGGSAVRGRHAPSRPDRGTRSRPGSSGHPRAPRAR